jgi:hypothetical protein
MYDYIITRVFLDVDPEDFRDAMDAETAALHDAHPTQYRRFILDGQLHTTLLGDVTGIIGTDIGSVELPPDLIGSLGGLELGSISTATVDDVVLASWITALVNDDLDGWPDLTDPPGPVPE